MKYHSQVVILLTVSGALAACIEAPENKMPTAKIATTAASNATGSVLSPEDEMIKGLIDIYGDGIKEVLDSARKKDQVSSYFLAEVYLNALFPNEQRELEHNIRKIGFDYAKNAAESNDPASYQLLSTAYGLGKGVIKSSALAVEWLEKAAAVNYGPALDKLCDMYYYGTDVEKDHKKALAYGMSAIKNGFPRSKSCATRIKVTQGPNEAFIEAITNWRDSRPNEVIYLGRRQYPYRFSYGESPTRLTRDSFVIWERLAAYGKHQAQKRVANMLYAGDGIESDPVIAYAWALLAKQDPSMKDWSIDLEGNRAVPKLTAKQRNESERLAAEWNPQNVLKRSPPYVNSK